MINNKGVKYHNKTIALCYSEAEKSFTCGNFSRNFEVHTRVVVDKKFVYARKSSSYFHGLTSTVTTYNCIFPLIQSLQIYHP